MVGNSDGKKVIFAGIFSTLEDLHVVVGHILYSTNDHALVSDHPGNSKKWLTRADRLLATTHMVKQ